MSSATPMPVHEKERIVLLDSLRGIAVLGILIMNIPGFGLPYAGIDDLAVSNDLSGIDFYTWFGVELTLAGTQRALFSMLFGAGMLLFISRLEKKSEGLLPAELYYRRQIWLLVFGLINTYLFLWFWDILFVYAVVGMLLFPFRRLPPKALFIAAGICLLLVDGRRTLELYREKKLVSKGEVVAAIDTTRTKLTGTQREHLGAYQEFRKRTNLESKKEDAEKNIRKTRGNWLLPTT